MSDESSPKGQPSEIPLDEAGTPAPQPNGVEAPAPRRRRSRSVAMEGVPPAADSLAAAADNPAAAADGPVAEAVSPRPRRTPAAAPAEAQAPPAPHMHAPLYGDSSLTSTHTGDEIPITGATIASLYDAEIAVRTIVNQQNGQASDLGAMAAESLRLVAENLRRMTEEQAEKITQMLHGVDLKDYLDPDFWKGIGMVLRYQIDEQVAFFQRRMKGEYTTDAYGMDRELIETIKPFLSFMYRSWWRVTPEGLHNVPSEGRALLVANHSGVLPWDGAMIAMSVIEDHASANDRIVRSLHLHWFSTLPFVAPALAAMGQVPGLPENAVRLLEDDELVCVFPEGLKGVGKLYKDRYKLARFGRGGFVQAAIRARAPIVPVAVVGAEEIYPMLANAEPVAKLLGMPYFPVTPFFPWLGPLGLVPLPSRWTITFCDPIRTDMYDPGEADDPLTVLGLTEMVRERIQSTIDGRLADRKSMF